jgi:HEAT repeat protein
VPSAPLPSTSFEQLGQLAVDKMLPLLQKEAHEATRIQGLYVLATLVKPMRSVPAALVERARSALKGEGKAPPAVRVAALHLAAAAFDGARLPEAKILLPELEASLEKAPSHRNDPEGQAQVAAAGHLYVRLARADVDLEARLQAGEVSCWTKLEGGAAFNSRFFRQADEAQAQEYIGLACAAMNMASQLAEDRNAALGQLSGWANGVVDLLLRGMWKVRRACAQRIRHYLIGTAPVVAEALLVAFQAAISELAQTVAEADQAAELLAAQKPEEGRGMQLHRPVLDSASNAPIVALHSICTRPDACDDAEARALLRAALLPSYHPLVVQARQPIFPSMVRKFGFSPESFLEEEAGFIFDHVTETLLRAARPGARQDSATAGLRALTHMTTQPGFETLKQLLVKRVLQELRSPQLLATSQDDVGILVTPEGELYDRSFMPKNEDDDLRKNSRDYHDLKWEREVRRELERKKGIRNGPKLTKQQEELKAKTLKKEGEVRERMRQLEEQVSVAFKLLRALLSRHGNPACMGDAVPALTPALLRAAKMSHLATSDACQAFVALSRALTRLGPGLAHSLARAILRASDVAAPLPSEWGREPVEAMAGRIARELWGVTHESEPLDDTAMAYCFPLIQYVLTSESEETKSSAREDVMVFLSDHAVLGRSRHLQRYTFIGLLVHVMVHHSRVAHQAGVLLVSFAAEMGDAARSGETPLKDNEVSVLMDAYYSAQQQLRVAALQALASLPLTPTEELTAVIWVARHDPDEECEEAGAKLWSSLGLTLAPSACEELLEPLASEHAPTREAAAKALGAALELHPGQCVAMITLVLERYSELLIVPEPVRDHIGNIISEPFVDPWPSRAGLAKGLAEMSPHVPPSELSRIFEFFVQCALGDPSPEAQAEVLSAGLALVDMHGQEHRAELLPIFERFLSTKSKTTEQDMIRQGAVVLLGGLAKHLAKDDPKIPTIVDTLIVALRTPSQAVQEAVAKCLPPLVASNKDRGPELISLLMDQLLEGASYGERRGAAYGLAGVVKGLGLLALKQQGVMARLLEAVQDQKTQRYREGALMAFELLCVTLGRFFEPYVGQVLPHLLTCFGDAKRDVRAATQDTARAIMGELTGHGVKLVLPSLLDALDDESWRTKQGSAQLLGSMAYCAPKQLSSCLPRVVPRLVSVLTDSHTKVQAAGKAALKNIGSVIRNPEISVLVPTIIKALNDPDAHAKRALDKLLNTAFTHVIDAPSLALLMPIIERALRDRSTDLKKRSAQIVGNMYSLTEAKDLVPYMSQVLPGLKKSLVDPVPEVRGVAARALGAMVKGMGESHFTELIPWMLETLSADVSSVDRAGAAQGLSEVLAGLGTERLQNMIPGFLAGTEHATPFVREGHLMLFVYLPATFGSDFRPFVASVIPPVLRGLSDVEEPVRATAMRVGQRIINSYAEDCIELLLPQLMEGLLDENWRIRESSVSLLGDLLYLLSGTSGKKTTATESEDDNFGTEASRQKLIDVLGFDLRNKVMAGIYMSRQDVSLPVRQSSVHVWKVIVTHTVRTLREVLPQLIAMLLHSLASDMEDRRIVGARTLGELVRKLGERILPEILPMLHDELSSPDGTTRQGVCVGLSEIMRSLTREQAEDYQETLVPAVRLALGDSLAAVREEAAQTFAMLHTTLGNQAIEAILPVMLNQLEDEQSCTGALDSLQRIMGAKSRAVLPFLVPRLTEQPVSAFNARALAHLTAVAGEALNNHLGEIMEAMLVTLEAGGAKGEGEEEMKDIVSAAVRVALAVGQSGLMQLVSDLTAALRSESKARRLAGAQVLSEFCQGTKVNLEEEMEELLYSLLTAFGDRDAAVVHAAWGGLAALIRSIKRDQVTCMRRILTHLQDLPRTQEGYVAGLAIPRGPEPLLPLFVDSLEISHPEAQLLAIKGLGVIASLASPASLEDDARTICGKLIRKLNDTNAQIKLEALLGMRTMLAKLGAKIKQFVPQLQPSVLKTLKDPQPAVRTGSVRLLTELLQFMAPKNTDRLLKEFTGRLEKQDMPELESTIHAVHTVGFYAADAPSPEEVAKVRVALQALIEGKRDVSLTQNDKVRESAGQALGMLERFTAESGITPDVSAGMLDSEISGPRWYQVRLQVLFCLFERSEGGGGERERERESERQSRALVVFLIKLSS